MRGILSGIVIAAGIPSPSGRGAGVRELAFQSKGNLNSCRIRARTESRSAQTSSRPCENSAWRDSQTAGAILESGMAHISGFERDQLLLLPEAVDDYVGSDNPVRFIDAFVDGLDLVEAGFGRVQPKATGRPGYAPGDLLKL